MINRRRRICRVGPLFVAGYFRKEKRKRGNEEKREPEKEERRERENEENIKRGKNGCVKKGQERGEKEKKLTMKKRK